MTLMNAIKPGTCSVVRLNRYDKHTKYIRFTVDIYNDNTLKKLLSSIEYNIFKQDPLMTLADEGQNDAPASPSYGDVVLVGSSPVGEFDGQAPGTLMEWTQDADPDMDGITEDAWVAVGSLEAGSICYISSLGEYKRWTGSGWAMASNFVGGTEWDAYFSTALFDQAGNDILKSIYTYLKSTPEFESTVEV